MTVVRDQKLQLGGLTSVVKSKVESEVRSEVRGVRKKKEVRDKEGQRLKSVSKIKVFAGKAYVQVSVFRTL